MITVLNKKDFDSLTPDAKAIAIRIVDPDEKHSNVSGYKDELKLKFWDVEDEIGKYVPIHQLQAKQIYDFLVKHKGTPLVVHCMAGMSRSNTIAHFYALHILKDDLLASRLASHPTRIINYAVWDALKEEAIKNNNWIVPFTKEK